MAWHYLQLTSTTCQYKNTRSIYAMILSTAVHEESCFDLHAREVYEYDGL